MSDLVPASGGISPVSGRPHRVVARAVRGLDSSRTIGLAQIEHRAELEAAKAHAVGYVGQQGMHAVAMLSQMEGQLGIACPLAVSRLQGIADMTALSIAQVVSDSARKIGR